MEKPNRSLTCTCKEKKTEKHTALKNKENKEKGKEEYEQCAATQNTKGLRPHTPHNRRRSEAADRSLTAKGKRGQHCTVIKLLACQ